jgi:hypothetical protein
MSTTLAGTALERRLVANRAYFDERAEPIAGCSPRARRRPTGPMLATWRWSSCTR